MEIKRLVKKISALSIGAAMLGATMTGALAAADLKDFPAPFVNVADKKYDYLMILGSAGKASDTVGATNIARGLDKVPVAATSGTSITVTGGKTEDVAIGQNIVSGNAFDNILEDDDISTFIDTTITFQSADYDVSEKLVLGESNNISVETSLTSSDDDYLTNVYVESARDSIKYFYAFDEAIELNKTKSSDPLEINLLGKKIKITSIDSDTKFTANVGAEYFMKVEDTVEVEGKTVKLKNVGSTGSIIIDVDGVSETIPSGSTETVSGIEIKNDETFYDANDVSSRSATLVIGKEATATYKDNDAYIGEDDNNPDWIWNVAGLKSSPATSTSIVSNRSGMTESGPILGIENDFVVNDINDNPPTAGECIKLPNNYVEICYESLTVADKDYMNLVCEIEKGVDVSEAGFAAGFTSEQTIYCHTNINEGIWVDVSDLAAANGSLSADQKTDKVWLWLNKTINDAGQQQMYVLFEDSNGRMQSAGYVLNSSEKRFAHINYNDVTNDDMYLTTNFQADPSTHFVNVTLVPYDSTDLKEHTDNISLWFDTDSTFNKTNSLGASTGGSSAEGNELVWQYGSGATAIGTKDEDHRTKYGLIIRDPKSHSASDEVDLDLPADMVRVNIAIKGTGAVVSGGAGTETLISQVAVAPELVTDAEVASVDGKNVILVGGSCINKFTAQFLGLTYPACGADSTLEAGESIIKLADNGAKVAMIVAGWEAEDTIRASRVLQDYKLYKDNLKGAEVKVVGTGKTVTSVESATTAAATA